MTEQEKGKVKPQPEHEKLPEPWLRGTLSDIAPVERAVLHSLELAREDINKWCAGLDLQQLNARLFGLPSPVFQLRHIARSVDRFLTYADGRMLSETQLAALASEGDPAASKQEVFREFESSLAAAKDRLLANAGRPLQAPVKIGRKGLSTSVGGLLVHMAEHTQRHIGQAVTTAKILTAHDASHTGRRN